MPRKRPRNTAFKNIDSDDNEQNYKIFYSIHVYFATAFNFSMILYVGFRTVIPAAILAILYILTTIIGYYIFKKKKVSMPALKAYCLVPTALTLLLSLNYFASFNSITETYRFTRNDETVTDLTIFHTRTQMTSLITLENDAYHNYYGIRVFLSHEDIKPTPKITFTFKTGILGLKVLTDYQFN